LGIGDWGLGFGFGRSWELEAAPGLSFKLFVFVSGLAFGLELLAMSKPHST
jgi:hypothetical protein